MMSVDPVPAKDYFWGHADDSVYFDDRDKGISGPGVLYLHGALHLFARGEETHKRVNSFERGALLEQFGRPLKEDDVPLIITEGDAASKEQSIRASKYLSFAHETFADDIRPLVVFGHSLGDSDSHLVESINTHRGRAIAVSVHMGGNWAEYCDDLAKRIRCRPLRFFDAASHPLGSPTLFIPSS